MDFTNIMIIIISLISLSSSINFKSIPESRSPPPQMVSPSAVLDKASSSIYIIGGNQMSNDKVISDVNSFNLKTMTWKKIRVDSDYIPSGITTFSTILRSDKKILTFGYFTEIFIFNLENNAWTKEELKGHQIGNVMSFGFTSFNYNSSEFVAIFGGMKGSNYINDLVLIDINTLESRKMENNGKVPSPRMGASLEYFNGSLYVFGYSFYSLVLGLETGSELFRYDLEGQFWEIVTVNGKAPLMRLYHYSCIYNNEMYILYGIITESTYEHNTVYKFNFATSTWHLLGFGTEKGSIASAKVQDDSVLYLLFGRDSTTVFNSIKKIDLSTNPPTFSVLVNNWLSPSERVYHCSFTINRKIYIFGGSNGATNGASSEVEVLYNDLWAFDVDQILWTSLNTLGAVPSPRKLFACSKTQGDVLAIFGGVGESGLLNDLYYLHEPELYWYKIISENDGPSVRYLSSLTFHNDMIFIVGGKNKDKGFDEIWTYDFASNLFDLNKARIRIPDVVTLNNLYDAKCWVEAMNNTIYSLLIVGGSDFNSYPNQKLVNFTFKGLELIEKSFKQLGLLQEQSMIGSETTVIVTENHIIRLGGSIYSLILLPTVLVYERSSEKYWIIPTRYQLELWGHSGVHFEDSIYIFGGGGSNEVYKSYRRISNNLIKVSFNTDDGIQLDCSPGTFNESCEPCPQGSYFLNGICMDCPPGRVNDILASTSVEQCMPCDENYYNDRPGASSCLQCPSSYACPIGSAFPKLGFYLPKNSSIQPSVYRSGLGRLEGLTTDLWYIFAGISAALLFFSICVHELWVKLKIIDLFVSHHGNELGVPVIHRKTSFGGVFTIFFCFACILTILAAFLEYTLNNIDEIRALVPVITLKEEISSKFLEINSTFYIYGGACIEDSNCSPLIDYQDSGLSYSKKSITCGKINENCFIYSKYDSLHLTSKNPSIRLILKEKFSFASALTVNISATSSIPKEISSIFTSIKPPKAKLFRGTSPSKIHLKFTPSVFTSEIDKWPDKETGFHVSVAQMPEAGSVAARETLNLQLHLRVDIMISESDTAMVTQRIENQSSVIFLGALLGSIFGMMGTFASFMGLIEKFTDKVERRKNAFRAMKEISERRVNIQNVFRPATWKRNSIKVAPIDTLPNTIFFLIFCVIVFYRFV